MYQVFDVFAVTAFFGIKADRSRLCSKSIKSSIKKQIISDDYTLLVAIL